MSAIFPAATDPRLSLQDVSPLGMYLYHLRSGRLPYQVVRATGKPVFFPRLMAPGTGDAAALEWRFSSGKGTVYATTVVHRRDEQPTNVALIDLDEGFRMMSTVRGVEPSDVRIGQRVMVEVVEPDAVNQEPVPVFRILGMEVS